MSTFTTPLQLEFVAARQWRLLLPFEYHVGAYPSATVIVVPVGFETDLASIPRALQWLFPPDGAYTKAAVLHDYLYRCGLFSRAQADAIFREAMQVLGVPAWQCWLIYRAVRVFGGAFYGG